jgi:hypothetical protein
MTKDIRSVKRRLIPFGSWLEKELNLKNYSKLDDQSKQEMIAKYLNANNLLDCEVGIYKGKETRVRFRLEETLHFWHECTWRALKVRGKRDYETEFDSTLVKEPYIEWFMEKRGTPALRVEKREGGRYWVYFFSPRYHWVCLQNFKDIKKNGTDERGNILRVNSNAWSHKFDCICGKREYIENLLWEKYDTIIDEDFTYRGANDNTSKKLTAQKVSGTSFDGYRYTFSIPALLQGKPEQELTLYSAEDKTEYLREKLARLGFAETGRPYRLDPEFDALDGVVKGKRIPFWYEHPVWGDEKYAIIWRSNIHERTKNIKADLSTPHEIAEAPNESSIRRLSVKYAWDKTELIRRRFAKCDYIIPEGWEYGKTYERNATSYKSSEKVPIPFLWNSKWHRITWNYFSAGLRVDTEKMLYFIRVRWRGEEYYKIGITKDSVEVRFANWEHEVIKTYWTSERRPEPQIKEVEDIVLFASRKFIPIGDSLREMNGGTECRTLAMDPQKTLLLIKKVFDDIDKKWHEIGGGMKVDGRR